MKIVDSVAAVLVHAGEVFTIRRQDYLDSFPGYDSFPGGKIEGDDAMDPYPVPFLREHAGAQMRALVREVREELGYDLVAGIAAGEVFAVRHLVTTLAPAIVPLRFRLHSYHIDLTCRPDFTLDDGEIAAAAWERPEAALERYRRGEALMVPPFRAILAGLAGGDRDGAFIDPYAPFARDDVFPVIELLDGLRLLPVPSRSLPPIKTTNAYLIGDAGAPQLLVDPSPAGPGHFATLCRTLAGRGVDALLITHHHPDHHEFAPELAVRLGVPLLMSQATDGLLQRRHGAEYLAGVKVVRVGEGETVTRWKGEAVRVHAVPGHDVGQIALAPASLRWFLVGDLIQGSGTVVIPPEEGDMAQYFATLERIIDLAPAVIVPSHGMPLRGTYRLAATLRHRREREAAILRLHRAGMGNDEILTTLYGAIDPGLLPMAHANIVAHLAKLRGEGEI